MLRSHESDNDVLHFKEDDEPYLAWLETHPNGYVLNIDTKGPREDMLHTARCGHLYPPTPGFRHTVYAKACSEDADALKRWASQRGHRVNLCSNCEVY